MPKARSSRISGIYAITNTTDGSAYIGQAQDIHRRWSDHRKHLRKGVMENIHLQRAWDRDGAEAFAWTIIEVCPIEQLDERETWWIANTPKAYNFLREAGTLRGVKRSPEVCANISRARKGIKRSFTSEEHRRHLSEALKGRRPSEATIEAARKLRIGKPLSAEHKRKVSEGLRGKKRPPRTPEQLEHYREAAIKRMQDPERRKRLSEAMKARKIAPSEQARIAAANAARKRTPEERQRMSEAQRLRRAKKHAENPTAIQPTLFPD